MGGMPHGHDPRGRSFCRPADVERHHASLRARVTATVAAATADRRHIVSLTHTFASAPSLWRQNRPSIGRAAQR